jgi:lipoate-protein ligase B
MTSSSFTKPQYTIERRRHSESNPWTYSDLNLRQREIAAQVRLSEKGAILLSELAPVITVGRRSPKSDLLLTRENLGKIGIDLLEVNRGGLATYHGAGQWVMFWVESLERLTGDRKGVRKAVEILLDLALEVGLRYRPQARIRSGAELGVWSPQGKFAAVGIQIEQGVLLHGLSLNGFKTPQSFQGLRPCGLDLPVDYLLEMPEKFDEEFERLGNELLEAAFSAMSRLRMNS